MYRLKYLNIFLILCLIIFVLLGCANEMKKETIHEGFPSEVSPASMELIEYLISNHFFTNHIYLLDETKEHFIYSKHNSNENENEVEYVALSKNELETFVRKYSSDSVKKVVLQDEEIDRLLEPIDPEGNLPEIHLKEGNVLLVKTEEVEKEFELPTILSQYDIQPNDRLTVNLVALNEEEMKLELYSVRHKLNLSLLLKNNLEHFLATQLFGDELEEVVQSGELESFKELFVPVGENESLRVITFVSNIIWDTETGELYQINDEDFLSNDGKFVYLAGNEDPLLEGEQRIQTVSDYVQENEEDYAQFSLDFKPLSELLEEKSSGNVTTAKVVYLAEDYVVIYANFAGPYIGNAGATNIIVDLQEDKNNPTFYVVDLNLHL